MSRPDLFDPNTALLSGVQLFDLPQVVLSAVQAASLTTAWARTGVLLLTLTSDAEPHADAG